MFDQGDSYSSVNAARNALSTFIPSTNKATIGSSREVCRLVKGVFEARPALPKHTNTWSVDSVLDCMCSLPEIAELTLKQLTLRTVMLLAQDKGVTPCICSKSETSVCTTTNVLLCSPVNTNKTRCSHRTSGNFSVHPKPQNKSCEPPTCLFEAE